MTPAPALVARTAGPDRGLRVRGLHKSYGPARVLRGVDLDAPAGEIHALLGENGAGKSTLMKVLSGVTPADRGEVLVDGRTPALGNPRRAVASGIRTMFQELSSIGHLTVAENLLFGHESRLGGVVRRRATLERARAVLESLGLGRLDPAALVSSLPLGDRQLLEVAKALREPAKVLVLDEATSALSAQDSAWVLTQARRSAEAGAVVLLITHRLGEVREVADRFTVLRSGASVLTGRPGDHTDDELVTAMLGRRVDHLFPARPAPRREAGVVVRGLTVGDRVGPVDFEVRVGEIFGLGGVQGQGQREVLMALAGAAPQRGGHVEVDGRAYLPRSPREALASGVAYVPEDRQLEGLFLQHAVATNMTAASLERLSRLGVVDGREETRSAGRTADRVGVPRHRLPSPVAALSGGNQQKVVLGKALLNEPRVLLLHDCTRGVDVGTKADIFALMAELAASGTSIVFYSSDLSELAHLCHRVLVMSEGRPRGVIEQDRLSEAEILHLSLGTRQEEAS